MRIPGPTKPAYVVIMFFSLVNRSERLFEVDRGRAVFETEVGVVSDPRGLPVWNTFVMLM
jgi:hypothetical protein